MSAPPAFGRQLDAKKLVELDTVGFKVCDYLPMRPRNLAWIIALAGASSSSAATLTFSLEEVGGNVTLSVSGSIAGLSGWFNSGSGGNPTFIQSGSFSNRPWETPGEINIQVTGSQFKNYTWFGGATAPSTFGTGGSYWETSAPATGDSVKFSPGGVLFHPFMGAVTYNPMISLPTDYVAGDLISTSAVFTGQTFNSLGLTPDSIHSWTYGIDTIQITVGSAVPEPSTYGLILGGLALAGASIRRRKAAR